MTKVRRDFVYKGVGGIRKQFLHPQFGKNTPEMLHMTSDTSAIYQDIAKVNDNTHTHKGMNASFISSIKILVALERLKGIMSHSYNLSRVLKAVYDSSPSLTRI